MRSKNRLLIVQSLSSLSLWIDLFLVFSVPVYVWDAKPNDIAALAFCLGAPMLFLGPIVGVLIDRLDVRLTLLVGVLVRVITTGTLAFAPSYSWFLTLVVLKGFSNLLYFPSSSIAVKQLIASEERISFFSSMSLFDQISKIATPLLAGALTFLIPLKYIFIVSASAALATVPILVSLWTNLHYDRAKYSVALKPIYADVLSGFQIFKSLPLQLRLGFLYSILTSAALAAYDPHLVSFLSSENLPPVVYSWIVSATAVGAVLAALFVKLWLKSLDHINLRALGLSIFSAAISLTLLVIFSSVHHKELAYVMIWILNGFGYELLAISSSVILQDLCPENSLGRVSTTFRSVQLIFVMFGPILGSILINNFGRSSPFILATGLTVFTALLSLFYIGVSNRSWSKTRPQC